MEKGVFFATHISSAVGSSQVTFRAVDPMCSTLISDPDFVVQSRIFGCNKFQCASDEINAVEEIIFRPQKKRKTQP